MLSALTADPRNAVFIVSGRARGELEEWFGTVPAVGLAAEHGFYLRLPGGGAEWQVQDPEAQFGWKDIVEPILQVRRGAGGRAKGTGDWYWFEGRLQHVFPRPLC